MDIEIIEEGSGPVHITQDIPQDITKKLLMNAIPYLLKGEFCNALFQQLPGDGFSVWYSQYWIGNKATVLRARAGSPVLELRIAWKNQINGTWDKITQPILKEYFFSIGFTPYILTRAEFEANKEYITMDLHFDLSFLEEMGMDFKTLDIFLKKVQNDQPAELSPFPHSCPGEMKDAVKAILKNKYSRPGKKYLLKFKAGEILLAALEAIGRTELLLPLPLKTTDINKLNDARDVIRENMPDWIGPFEICRKTGLNQLKLKIGFNHLFDQTPYEYFLELRMDEAKRLLIEGKESITDIAYLAGYKHTGSFSKQFRKTFGYTASDFLKNWD